MTDADKRAALKCELVATGKLLTESDAIGVLDGRPQRTTIKSILRQIGETDGFGYGRGQNREKSNAEDRLKIDNRDAVETSPDHERVLKALADDPEDMDADGGSPEVDDPDAEDEDAEQWVRDAAEMLSDVPLDKVASPDETIARKIVLATTEDVGAHVAKERIDGVTDEQVTRVRRYVDNDAEAPGTTGPRGGVEADQTPMDTPDMDAAEDMDEIAAAEPVRTDGGSPEVDLGDPDAGDAG